VTTLKTYAGWINQAAAAVASKIGVSIAGASKTERVQARVTTGLIAGLVKLLVDKGVITDAEVQAALSIYGNDSYSTEPIDPAIPTAAQPDDVTNPPPPPVDPPPPDGP
jgi:hypothetical protein